MRKKTRSPQSELKLVEEVVIERLEVEEEESEPVESFDKMCSDDSKAQVVAKSELTEEEFEDSWGEEELKESTAGWIVGSIVCGLVGLVGLAVWGALSLFGGEEVIVREQWKTVEIEKENQQIEKDSVQAIREIKDQVSHFFAAQSVNEAKEFIDMRERVAALMDDYYGDVPWVPKKVTVGALYPLTVGLSSYWMASVEGDFDGVVLVAEKETGYAVDWESYVAYNPVSLAELLEGASPEGVDFRLYARIDDFYTFDFDEDSYQCLRLTARGEDVYLWAYLEKNSPEGVKFQSATNGGKGFEKSEGKPLMLQLRKPGVDTRGNIFVVEDFISSNWLVVGE